MATNFKFLSQEQADKLHKMLSEVGFTGPLAVTVYNSQGDMFQATIEPPKPDHESYEARKAEILSAITNRKNLPSYAYYGNHGDVYLKYKVNGEWVHGGINFFDVVEATARRILKSVTP